MRTILTGGTGFVGKHLQDIIGQGFFSTRLEDLVVTGRDRSRDRGLANFVEWEAGSETFPDMPGEALIHAATPASAVETRSRPEEMYQQIIGGAAAVIDWCSRQRKAPRVLFLSSGAVYGDLPRGIASWAEDSDVAENEPTSANAYESGKRAAEALFVAAGRDGVCRPTIARLFSFSGRHLPLNRHFAIGNFVRDALEGRDIEVRGSGNAVRSYLDGDDLARWLLTALESPEAVDRVIHVGSEVATSIREVAEVVADRARHVLGRQVNVRIHGRRSAIDGYNRYVPSTSETRSLLGLAETVGLAESIDDMLRSRMGEHGGTQ